MVRRLTKLLAIVLSLVALGIVLAVPAHAEEISPQGTCGTCSWEIDNEGLLRIYPTDGEAGELGFEYGWSAYADSITAAVVADGVRATSLANLFYDCDSLTTVDLSGLDTVQVTDVSCMFYSCDVLRTVFVGDTWSTENVVESTDMFSGCVIIAGGLGTTYDPNFVDVAYARVDSEDAPGYFVAAGEEPVHAPGWAFEDDAHYYYELNGSMRTSAWVKSGGSYYYVGKDGKAVSNNWVSHKGSWYYLNANGNPLAYTWSKIGGSYYYFDKDGKLATNRWFKLNGKYYYVGSDGKALVNQRVKYNGTYYYFGSAGYLVTSSTSSQVGSLNAMISAAKRTPTTGAGGCARWVTNVFTNAGIGTWNGSARDMYNMYCTSSDRSALRPGMIIAVPSTGGTYAALLYGHVGIYLGNGVVMHNLKGVVGTMSLSTWISYCGGYATPKWGWFGGVVLY